MSIIAADKATPIVQRFVLSLNTVLASTPQKPPARAGEKRATARIAAQTKAMRKWHASAAKALSKIEPSRQVRRRMNIKAMKSGRSAAKREAMKSKLPGGSARIRA